MDPGRCPLVERPAGTGGGSFVECGRCRTAELIRKGIRLFKDVTRDRAKSLTRAGQVGALTLASLAGVVLAVGLPGTSAPKFERTETVEPTRVADSGPEREKPAILERRAVSIAANLKQLGNAPKEPPPIAPEAGDDTGEQPQAPVPVVQETAMVFLGLLGSSARPMALVSIDSHQQVLAVGDVVRKGSGETIKLVRVEKNGIEIETKGGTRKVELAPRTGAAYTTLQNSPSGAAPNPGLTTPMSPAAPPPGTATNRPRRENEMRAPGPRRQRFDESGGARE